MNTIFNLTGTFILARHIINSADLFQQTISLFRKAAEEGRSSPMGVEPRQENGGKAIMSNIRNHPCHSTCRNTK